MSAFGEQRHGLRIDRPRRGADPDGDIEDAAARHVIRRVCGRESYDQAGMRRLKAVQARDQPAHGETAEAGHRDIAGRIGADCIDAARNPPEGILQHGEQALARCGQPQPAALVFQERQAELVFQAAQNALKSLDVAIARVDTYRSTLGAASNRLQYEINNLGTQAENMKSAESQIRDVDMASEMTTMTQRQIMMQAATAMLAQANAQPQSILSLFQ